MGNLGKVLAAPGQFSINYGQALLKDLEQDNFARHPLIDGKRIATNHPAWVYGHLAIYSSTMCGMLGIDVGPTARPDGWDELFKNGTECRDDPANTIYPAMNALTSHFLNGYKHVIAHLPEVSDDVLLKPNPAGGRFTEMLPTVGNAVAFLVIGHPQMHLGQASTWRRTFGLGPAM